MGSAALTGLGIALAKPEYQVLVITGDGEQLMGLGGLATIGVQNPANLSVVVMDNGHYGETGMQQSHTAAAVDLAAIAAACGFARAELIQDAAGVENLAANLFDSRGASFSCIRVEARNLPRSIPVLDGSYIKNRFRSFLGYPPC